MNNTRVEVTRAGISFGSALAIAISWSANKSLLWAIVHGLFSWFYVIYYAVRYHCGVGSVRPAAPVWPVPPLRLILSGIRS